MNYKKIKLMKSNKGQISQAIFAAMTCSSFFGTSFNETLDPRMLPSLSLIVDKRRKVEPGLKKIKSTRIIRERLKLLEAIMKFAASSAKVAEAARESAAIEVLVQLTPAKIKRLTELARLAEKASENANKQVIKTEAISLEMAKEANANPAENIALTMQKAAVKKSAAEAAEAAKAIMTMLAAATERTGVKAAEGRISYEKRQNKKDKKPNETTLDPRTLGNLTTIFNQTNLAPMVDERTGVKAAEGRISYEKRQNKKDKKPNETTLDPRTLGNLTTIFNQTNLAPMVDERARVKATEPTSRENLQDLSITEKEAMILAKELEIEIKNAKEIIHEIMKVEIQRKGVISAIAEKYIIDLENMEKIAEIIKEGQNIGNLGKRQ